MPQSAPWVSVRPRRDGIHPCSGCISAGTEPDVVSNSLDSLAERPDLVDSRQAQAGHAERAPESQPLPSTR